MKLTEDQQDEIDLIIAERAVFDRELADISPLTVCGVIAIQQLRMNRYETLIHMASCEEERKVLYKAYEVSRLIHIKHEDVIERSSWLLRKDIR